MYYVELVTVADSTECQDSGTNDCAQLCTRNVSNGTTTYTCSCNEGYSTSEISVNLCDGT